VQLSNAAWVLHTWGAPVRKILEDENRFENDASRYDAYLDTPEGRLRTDLTFANLQEFLPVPDGTTPLHALDLGGGTGAASVRLARLGLSVALLDSSSAMLDLAKRTVIDSGSGDKITLKRGDAARVAEIFESQSFDIVLCHNLLEYVDDPEAVLRAAQHEMRNSSSILSVLVRNQAGEVLRAALQTGDLVAAEDNLTAEWGQESLYGGNVRFFTPERLEAMLKDASLRIAARRGVRIVSDYVPAKLSRSEQYQQIFVLERKLGARQEFFGVARYLHYLVRREATGSERTE
jgi:S-adenosylmethionine-dependent methyltransferase